MGWGAETMLVLVATAGLDRSRSLGFAQVPPPAAPRRQPPAGSPPPAALSPRPAALSPRPAAPRRQPLCAPPWGTLLPRGIGDPVGTVPRCEPVGGEG
jgi:hypothetical protein